MLTIKNKLMTVMGVLTMISSCAVKEPKPDPCPAGTWVVEFRKGIDAARNAQSQADSAAAVLILEQAAECAPDPEARRDTRAWMCATAFSAGLARDLLNCSDDRWTEAVLAGGK